MIDFLMMKLKFILSLYPLFYEALGITFNLGILSLVLSIILALAWVFLLRLKKKILTAAIVSMIEVLRNTPLLLQMYILYFGLPVMGWRIDGFYCGVFAIALQHSAFLAEIFRGAIDSISNKQWEAGRALGMKESSTMWLIILPQASIRVLAAIGNQLIILIKDTSIVSGIAVMELTLTGKMILERNAASFEVFIVVATYYLGLTVLFGYLVRVIETRTNKYT